ncbi:MULTISPECIES: hypothetical protein [unclassified Pseudomonas]|uniref:hypothetical protein n=1 Tax=unclassified Pseudomonas TaxID=196821 RepID=UPI000A9C6E8B|nr:MULTISPECIES: hypothetical protein [unclassified Pseudomonas]
MSKTAYSISFKRELDVEQLLALHLNCSVDEAASILGNVPADLKSFVQSDVRCPYCGVSGGLIVNAGKARGSARIVKQAHFRFVNNRGEEAHLDFCEQNPKLLDRSVVEGDVSLSSSRSNLMRQIRELVCKGIEQGVFNQGDMVKMRRWYYEVKLANGFDMSVSPLTLEFTNKLLQIRWVKSVPFHPSHPLAPNYDWNFEAKAKLVREQKELIRAMENLAVHRGKGVEGILQKNMGRRCFDPSELRPCYEKTISLCCYLARCLGQNIRGQQKIQFGDAPSEFLALCSLILFVYDWDLNKATAKISFLLSVRTIDDRLLGNIIGLNPFHDYEAWRVIKGLHDLSAIYDIERDFNQVLDSYVSGMKLEHAEWRMENGIIPSPPSPPRRSLSDDLDDIPF